MSTMRAESNYFVSRDGTKLYYSYHPCENARGLLCIYHGFAEHLGRYEHVVATLLEAQYAVYCFDQRGHGRSEGPVANVKSFVLGISIRYIGVVRGIVCCRSCAGTLWFFIVNVRFDGCGGLVMVLLIGDLNHCINRGVGE